MDAWLQERRAASRGAGRDGTPEKISSLGVAGFGGSGSFQRVGRGAILTIPQVWLLAQLWYGDRLSPDFRRRTMDEAHAIFERVGLTGAFWRLDSREER